MKSLIHKILTSAIFGIAAGASWGNHPYMCALSFVLYAAIVFTEE